MNEYIVVFNTIMHPAGLDAVIFITKKKYELQVIENVVKMMYGREAPVVLYIGKVEYSKRVTKIGSFGLVVPLSVYENADDLIEKWIE